MDRQSARTAQSRAGRLLARHAGALLAGVDPASITVGGGGNVPPRFEGGLPEPVALSISHSGAYVAAAAAFGLSAIGLDLQLPRPAGGVIVNRGWQRYFVDGVVDTPAAQERFAALWTLWEAAVKCDAAPLLSATTPAFDALLDGFAPGTERAWRGARYWASSRRHGGTWLTLVGRDDGSELPELAWREVAPLAAY